MAELREYVRLIHLAAVGKCSAAEHGALDVLAHRLGISQNGPLYDLTATSSAPQGRSVAADTMAVLQSHHANAIGDLTTVAAFRRVAPHLWGSA